MASPRIVVIIAISLFLLACASPSINLSANSKKNIVSVSISDTVVFPSQALFSGSGSDFDVVGIHSEFSQNKQKAIATYLEKNKIDIALIVMDSFSRQAAGHSLLAGKLASQADTIIELEVLSYGLGQKVGFSSKYKPILSVIARMKNSGNTVIWSQREFVSVIGGSSPAKPLEKYFTSPEIFRIAFKTAADNIAKQLLDRLN